MKKVEHVTFQTQIRSEQFVTPLPNLQQLDSLKNSLTELEDEEILRLNTRVAECGLEIKKLERGMATLSELRSIFKEFDRDKREPITVEDVEAQIKLYKRQIHIYESRIRKSQDKIQAIVTKDINKSERYTKQMPELKLRHKEINREIQKIKSATAILQKAAECSKRINIFHEDVIRKEDIQQQIQVLEKDKQKNELRLQKIEEKISALEEQETRQNGFLASSSAKQLFLMER